MSHPPEVALVTGASSGIGEEFARQLSARGHEVVLVARRRERLEEIAAALPARAHVLPCDLETDAAALAPQAAELGLEVALLVNNAGFGSHDRFWEIADGRDAAQVRLNCEAVVTLTRAFLPSMVERGSGGVINIASIFALAPLPYEAVYAATKAFVLSFSEALHTELRSTGVRALAVCPGPVATEWQRTAGVEDVKLIGAIPVERVVRESLVAYDRGRRSVRPGTMSRWGSRAQALVPRAMRLRLSERIGRRLRNEA